MYSHADGRYLPDRYIEGTCPNCGFDSARGDQCDNCTKQLDPVDLINPHSTISGSTDLEMRETKHLYLRQSQMKDQLEAWIDSKTDWPVLTTSIAKKWLHDGDGLQDRGITRDLDWGIPVRRGDADWPGMEGKVFYVWFDAPIEYIACSQEWVDAGKGSDWQRWWRTDQGADDVTYTQFMGKDNVPFHTLSFPATILGSGEPWKLVDYIKSFNYLNYDGGQFSTSRGRGVFYGSGLGNPTCRLLALVVAFQCTRKFRCRIHMGKFPSECEQRFGRCLGNFVSRITKFCRSKFGEVVPEGGSYGEQEEKLIADITARLRDYETHMNAIDVRKAAAELRAIWVAGNEYLQSAAPWSTFKEDPETAAAQVRLGLNLIRFYAVLSAPFIPSTAARMMEAMQTSDNTWPSDVAEALSHLTTGHEFRVPDVLFAKINYEQREEWQDALQERATKYYWHSQ